MSNSTSDRPKVPEHFTIAISGKSGCGNSTVSRLCSEHLGIQLVNFTFRQLAEEKGVDFGTMCAMAEESSELDRELDRRQVEMARETASVLGSRLAIWILEDADLKVYLEASPGVRAERVFKREGGSLERSLRETAVRDRRDHDRYMKIYGIDNDNYSFADLIIDTDSLEPEDIMKMIVERALPAIPHVD
jgi:cytidylate kinase